MIKSPPSLQKKLLVMVISIVLGVWLVTVAFTWYDARHELDELLDSHLAQAAALLVVQQAQDIEENKHGIDAPVLHRYAPKVAFQVFHEGRLTLRSANAPATPMTQSGQNFKTGFESVRIGNAVWRVFAAYGAERDVQVYVGEQVDSRASILLAVLRSTLWPMAVALPLLGLTLWWAVYSGLSPLRRLGNTLTQRQPDALHPVAVDGITSEMTPMVNALNDLFQRIGTLLELERRFTADAAHELRTPIAAIRMQAQVAMGETDVELRKHALQSTLDGCDRATRLVEQMLTLSRLDANEAPAMMPVDLVALAKRTVAELAPKAFDKNQTLELDAPESCSVIGNEILLAVLLRNLIDNAIRYSPSSARIKARVQRRAEKIVLSIDDSGPGLTETDRSRLGERFFRVAGSNESGSGLGWSIVRRIAAAHGMTCQVEQSAQLGGLAVHVIAEDATAKKTT